MRAVGLRSEPRAGGPAVAQAPTVPAAKDDVPRGILFMLAATVLFAVPTA